MLGQFASRVGGKMCKALPYDILILKRQVLSKCCGLEHECEALGGHWGSVGGSLGVSKTVLGGPWRSLGGHWRSLRRSLEILGGP